MSGFYKKAVVWLGLDEQYPDNHADGDLDHEGLDAETRHAETRRVERGVERGGAQRTERGSRSGVSSSMDSQQSGADDDELAATPRNADRDAGAKVRAVPLEDSSRARSSNSSSGATPSGSGSSGTVRAVPLAVTATPETVVPTSFNNAQDVADVYKRSHPVVVDLTSAERDLARRLIDFSAGLCYGLGGQMEKLERDRYLLIPEGIELTAADRRALEHS